METSEGHETSQKVAPQEDCQKVEPQEHCQKVAPQEHCQKVAPQEHCQPDDKDNARQDMSTEVFDVSSDSNCDADICDGVS